jgi:hypothetical protein
MKIASTQIDHLGLVAGDQKGKPRQRPTLRWICFLFYGVAEVTVEIGKEVNR